MPRKRKDRAPPPPPPEEDWEEDEDDLPLEILDRLMDLDRRGLLSPESLRAFKEAADEVRAKYLGQQAAPPPDMPRSDHSPPTA